MILFLILCFIFLILIRCYYIKTNKFLYLSESKIHGNGIFTSKNIKKDNFILNAIDKNNHVTDIGTKINHSYNPNALLTFKLNKYNLYAIRDINRHEEITANYNDTPDFINKPNPNWI